MTSILLLGLGIGITTIFYSFVQAIVFAPLPFPEPNELVAVKTINERKGIDQETISVAEFRDYYRSCKSFESLAAYRGDFKNYLPENGKTEQWLGVQVTADFFQLFKTSPLGGRCFGNEDFKGRSGRNAILSYEKWRDVFAKDRNVIGTNISLNGELYQIIGIMPKGFREPYFADIWFAFPDTSPEYYVRNSRYWSMIGRLGKGMSIDQANAELSTYAQNLARSFPKINKGWTTHAVSLLEVKVGSIRNVILLGFVASLLVLITTSLNITNLILARSEKRRIEFATRLAIGCSSRHVYFQVISETLGITFLAGSLGSLVWYWSTKSLPDLLPLGFLPRSNELQNSYTPLLFVGFVSTITGIFAGLLPAMNLAKTNLLNSSRTSSSSSKSMWVRNSLVSLQVANLTIICVLSLLLFSSFRRISETPLGFDPDNLITVTLSPNPSTYMDMSKLGSYYESLKASVDALPEVQQSSITMFPPLFGFNFKTEIELKGDTRTLDETLEANYSPITHEFFDLLKIPLKNGRFFSSLDTKDSQKVVIVTDAFAKKFFPNQNVIGKEITLMPWVYSGPRRIVGVVKDYKQSAISEKAEPHVFVPMQQGPWPMAHLIIKPRHFDSKTEKTINEALEHHDPSMGFVITPLEDYISRQTAQLETITNTIIVFAIITALLTAIGLFALVVINTSEQQKEIAIRLALGASRKSLGIKYTLRGMRMSFAGVVVGIVLIGSINKFLNGHVDEMHGVPYVSYILAAFVVLGISFFSTMIPSVNGTFVDLNKALNSN